MEFLERRAMAIEISDVHKSYGRGARKADVLIDFQMNIPKGHIYALLGKRTSVLHYGPFILVPTESWLFSLHKGVPINILAKQTDALNPLAFQLGFLDVQILFFRSEWLWKDYPLAVHCGEEDYRFRDNPGVWRQAWVKTGWRARPQGWVHAPGTGALWRVYHQGDSPVLWQVLLIVVR